MKKFIILIGIIAGALFTITPVSKEVQAHSRSYYHCHNYYGHKRCHYGHKPYRSHYRHCYWKHGIRHCYWE